MKRILKVEITKGVYIYLGNYSFKVKYDPNYFILLKFVSFQQAKKNLKTPVKSLMSSSNSPNGNMSPGKKRFLDYFSPKK